jgi:hypothetical protein
VFTTLPEDDLVQYVRHQYLAVLGSEPDAAAHYNYSNQLLLCGTDQACIAQRKSELNAFLKQSGSAELPPRGWPLSQLAGQFVQRNRIQDRTCRLLHRAVD